MRPSSPMRAPSSCALRDCGEERKPCRYRSISAARLERVEQAAVHAAEAAVAHDQDMIAGTRGRRDLPHQGVEVVERLRTFTQRRQRLRKVPAERVLAVARAVAEHEISLAQA